VRRAVTAAIAFGSNVGDRARHIETALARLREVDGVRVGARSLVRETEPVGGPPQGRFLNGVALVETTLTAGELLAELLAIERAGGRVRAERDVKNGPRTIDLDLVFYGDAILEQRGLTLPHPRAHERSFVLEPLAEVAPDWTHPRLRRTAREMWDAWSREHARPESSSAREPSR
jgi:2-amino-4-hydroxy-6-hydroxymethyldihydropteridine diphosphokinase